MPSGAGFPGPGRGACSQASLSAPWWPVLTYGACALLTHVPGKTQPRKTVRASLKALGPSSGSVRARPATLWQCPSGPPRPEVQASLTRHLRSARTVVTPGPVCPHARLLPGLCKGPGASSPKPTRPPHAGTHTHTRVFSTLSPLVTQSLGGAGAKAHPAPTHLLLTAQCPSRFWSPQRLRRGQRPGGRSGRGAERQPRWAR